MYNEIREGRHGYRYVTDVHERKQICLSNIECMNSIGNCGRVSADISAVAQARGAGVAGAFVQEEQEKQEEKQCTCAGEVGAGREVVQ